MWAYQTLDLTDRGVHCVAYDQRGYGRSDQPRRSQGASSRYTKERRMAIIDTGKLDRVLQAAHHHRLLVVRPAGSAPLRQTDSFLITPRVVGMKDDGGPPHRRPSHRLGIAPALMANRHSKLHPVDLEESPGIAGHIELIFGRVESARSAPCCPPPPRPMTLSCAPTRAYSITSSARATLYGAGETRGAPFSTTYTACSLTGLSIAPSLCMARSGSVTDSPACRICSGRPRAARSHPRRPVP
jgi:hypothetical protein